MWTKVFEIAGQSALFVAGVLAKDFVRRKSRRKMDGVEAFIGAFLNVLLREQKVAKPHHFTPLEEGPH